MVSKEVCQTLSRWLGQVAMGAAQVIKLEEVQKDVLSIFYGTCQVAGAANPLLCSF